MYTDSAGNFLGCFPNCTVVPGWECTTDANGRSNCTAICGDNVIDASKGEVCDTGNAFYSFVNYQAGERGNAGTVNKNVNPNYDSSLANKGHKGCASDCKSQLDGYQCFTNASAPTQGGVCWKGCGDGNFTGVIPGVRNEPVTFPIEECDDGNNIDGDGCSRTCQLEDPLNNFDGRNWTCTFVVQPDNDELNIHVKTQC